MAWTRWTLVHLGLLIACTSEPGLGTSASDSGTPSSQLCRPGPAPDPYTYTDADTGTDYLIQDGKIYDVTDGGTEFVADVYDVDFFENSYVVEGDKTYISNDGVLIETTEAWQDSFETYDSFRDLFAFTDIHNTRWHRFNPQSAAAPDPDSYIPLSQCIIDGTCDFIDNRVDLVDDNGNQVLEFYASAGSAASPISKMSIFRGLNCFGKGDEFWASFRLKAISGLPGTVLDLESTYLLGQGGPRITLFDGSIAVELKFGSKPIYRPSAPNPFPLGRWVTVVLHLTLSEDSDGVIQVWQDGEQIIDAQGQNLPLSDTILDQIEVGISATIEEATIQMDDVQWSSEPLL